MSNVSNLRAWGSRETKARHSQSLDFHKKRNIRWYGQALSTNPQRRKNGLPTSGADYQPAFRFRPNPSFLARADRWAA
jgi:hypothetical protein